MGAAGALVDRIKVMPNSSCFLAEFQSTAAAMSYARSVVAVFARRSLTCPGSRLAWRRW